ncbi:YMGG-like glycine zipper-containing protein [Akkermansiaceae bacterium]|nr:YMGG-like glycine zipper-containing protein [Akkermansiaceae bacterium]
MKKTLLTITAIAATALFPSCGGTPSQQAAGGALLGAGLGAIIGHQSGHAAEGAAVGAAAGGLGGYATAPQPRQPVYYR